MLTALCLCSLALAALPALMFLANLREYRAPGPAAGVASVSVLIPARDEGASVGAAVAAALGAAGVDLEVVVLDDHSADDTAAVVRGLAARDPRVRLHEAPALPGGWSGKQHACLTLAGLASKPVLVFIDADVRLAPDGPARLAAFLGCSGADLVSGLPRQVAVGPVEQMVIPLMHFVLLGFLPLRRMRADRSPRFAAGCGQLFATTKSAYERSGGHGHPAVRGSFHDGLTLPRAYREAGLVTDLVDATGLASCRMYRSAGGLWSGLSKNATEGIATPRLIVPATLVLFAGQVLPLLLVALPMPLTPAARSVAWVALGLAYLPRLVAVARFRQPLMGATLHPVGILTLLAIQWYALARGALGRPATWKGRPRPAV